MASREDLYDEAARTYGAALDRLARAYESDPDQQRDLLQDIHLSLWRSFSNFDGRCSLRTWIYRVAHNVAASHVASDRRARSRHLLSLDEFDRIDLADPNCNTAQSAERSIALERLLHLIQQLKPLDRQLVLLFLEGVDAAEIGDITGISPGNVATRIHRIKKILTTKFQTGEAS